MSGFVIAVLLALFASGAAQALTTVNQSSATAQNPLPVIQVQKDTLVVGSEQDYPPFATGMTDATAGGFSVDLWKAVAAEAGLNYAIRVRPFHQILQEFKEGKIDVLINLAHSDERHQFADFTVPHVIAHGAIFVRKGESGIRTEDDLAGKSIIVLNADLAHDYAVSKGWEKQLVLVDTSAEGMRLLASGKHDAMLLNKLAGMQTLQVLGLPNIEALKVKAGFSQKFAFAVPEGQSELLGKLNEGLALTKSNGAYNALYDKWFGVYEVKEVGLRDMLKYLIMVVVVFLGIAGYFFYRRQVERAEAEKKYRDLYDHAPDMLLSCEAKSATIIDCNQTLLDATGYSREELVGRSAFELYHPDCTDLARTALQKFMDTKEVHGLELQLRRKDGSKVDVSLSASAVCDEHGAILYSRSALRDITEHKKAEEELRTLSTMVEQSPLSVVITDLDANILYVNPYFTNITGYSREEAIGQNPRILQSGLTPRVVYTELWNSLTSGKVWRGELVNKRKNGELYWEEAHIVPAINSAGITTHYVAVKLDITQRKQAEHVLAESEERYRLLVESSPFCVHEIDLEGRFQSMNRAGLNMLGLGDAEKICGMPYLSAVSQQDAGRVGSLLRDATTNGTPSHFEFAASGDVPLYFKSCFIPIKNTGGKVLKLMGITEDITGRKKAEKARLRAETKFHMVFDNTSDAIVIHHVQGRFLEVNQTMCERLGYSREEFLHLSPPDINVPEGVEKFAERGKALMAQGQISFETVHVTKDGRKIPVEVNACLIDYAGKPATLSVVRDITERKKYEEELKRSNAELEQFGYAISHDMRQPLRMISSYLQLIEISLADQLDSEKRDYFNFAIDGAKRIDQMLVALLDYSRVGRKGEPSRWIESRAVFDEALLFLQPGIAEAQAALNIAGEWPRIFANHDEILRLLQNLIGNAAKFRVAGRAPEITVTSKMAQNEWHLCVADNGIGLIPDQINRLFQMFQRLQLRTAYEGNGVGLALCRKIAEHYKGRIWAESAGEGQGSKFYVVLPVPQEGK
ncbi:MAG: PAS domain S-box protein [Gallionella sp.]|nr:PAS domain S-box protein [Gallionella sp.]